MAERRGWRSCFVWKGDDGREFCWRCEEAEEKNWRWFCDRGKGTAGIMAVKCEAVTGCDWCPRDSGGTARFPVCRRTMLKHAGSSKQEQVGCVRREQQTTNGAMVAAVDQ